MKAHYGNLWLLMMMAFSSVPVPFAGKLLMLPADYSRFLH
jgi:hypothetical protein